jgi:hypothetical protein
MSAFGRCVRGSTLSLSLIALIQSAGVAADQQHKREVEIRSRIAAANLEDAIVVDCQLPGTLQKLGGMRTYLTPGTLVRLAAVDCRSRGGEYTLGDLSSGTLSLDRWMPLAERGDAEAQYYVARIYANGMGGVPVDYTRAVTWYERAAQQQYSSALQELGYLYEQGLGVQRDAMQALNLQRQAAGLGAELDYAWKITAAQEEAARQVASLTDQLEQSNSEVETLRAQVASTNDALFKSRADLGRSETALLDLKEQLKAANESKAAVDASHVQDLQRSLAAKEEALAQARIQFETLATQARAQQGDLNDRLARTQLSSRELSELLANEQAKNRSLVARAAQTEQRLLSSQQELTQLRDQYRAEVEQMAAQRDEIERAAAQNKDAGAGLVAAAERELERQKLRVASLEQALAAARAPAKKDDSAALLNNLKQLQAQYDEQRRKYDSQRAELADLRTKSAQERTALVQQMNEQIAQRAAELDTKQRRLASLTAETDTLRSELDRMREQRERESSAGASEATQAREALRMAQGKISEQRERLQRMQTERATDVAKLTASRAQLEKQLATVQQASETKVAFLRQDLEERRKDIEAKDAEIGRLEQRLAAQTKQLDAMMAGNVESSPAKVAKAPTPAATTASTTKSGADAYLNDLSTLKQGSYHALVIGNSDYRYIGGLATPTRDARDLAKLLEERYDFKVRLLTNVTSDQIMMALHDETLTLTESDNLLIYYAGQGDATDVPGRAFWLGVDADPDTRKGWLEADHIRAKIKEMKAKHVLLVVDSCFSDMLTHPNSTTIGRGLNETRLRVQLNRRARMVLTSGQVPPMPDTVGDRSHSAFARQFLQILRQNNTIMSGEMLSHELSERLQAAALTAQVELRQKPTYSTLKDANHDVGDFFFLPTPEPVRVAGL